MANAPALVTLARTLLLLLVLLSINITIISTPAAAAAGRTCRTTPDDALWPTAAEWSAFNSSVDGRLMNTVPLAAPCHRVLRRVDGEGGDLDTFDAAECAYLQEHWADMDLHVRHPTSLFNTANTNGSCIMTSDPSTSCTLGFHPSHTVNISSPSQISTTIAFAREHNLRLVIRNTGHEYIGKSTGAHGLEIWTQHLKAMTYHRKLPLCGGVVEHAITAGAGVLAGEVYEFARENGRVVVGPQCTTVGWAGGYIQGGGQSPLMLHYGLGGDQLVSATLVTAAGAHITASACSNADLFWALAGGGGGTFGVVTSVTVRSHADQVTSGAILDVALPPPTSANMTRYWAALEDFYRLAPAANRRGVYMGFRQALLPGPQLTRQLTVSPFIAYGLNASSFSAAIAPFLRALDTRGVPYALRNASEFPTYLDAIDALYVVRHSLPYIDGSRLIPRDVAERDPAAVVRAIREINRAGLGVYSFILSPAAASAAGRRTADNAANPAWDGALSHAELMTFVEADATPEVRAQATRNMTALLERTLVRLAPHSGAYLNEANPGEPNWQQSFYGCHYPRLLQIKKKWDPETVFWAPTAVGSEGMAQDDVTGLLCDV